MSKVVQNRKEGRLLRLSTPPWTEQEGATRDVALEVLINGPISRAAIARKLGLSAGSLTRLSQPLIESGLLIEVGEHQSGQAGRPSRLLDVVPESRHFVGLKLTGYGVLGVVTDLRAGVISTCSRSFGSHEPALVVDVVSQVIEELAIHVPRITAVGIGIGALVEPGGIVHGAPFLGWGRVELASLVERSTHLPVVVSNDVVAFTEYERWFGGGRNIDRFAVLTLGAGIGYGLVMNGEVVSSDDAGIGLVGHWPLDPLGALCPSGHRGCAQTVLAQEGICRSVSQALDRDVKYDEALALARQGEPAARRVIDDAGRGLGYLIAAVANLTMPEVVILGGEGVALVSVASGAVAEGIAERRDSRANAIPTLATSGDDTEWCRGAAVLALQTHVLGTSNSTHS